MFNIEEYYIDSQLSTNTFQSSYINSTRSFKEKNNLHNNEMIETFTTCEQKDSTK